MCGGLPVIYGEDDLLKTADLVKSLGEGSGDDVRVVAEYPAAPGTQH